MAKKKEINPKSGMRVKELLAEHNMTQEKLSEKLDCTVQHMSQIVTGKKRLTEENARIIAGLFPPVRFEWLMGLDDYKTVSVQAQKFINEINHEGNLLYTGIAAFGELAGYNVTIPDNSERKKIEDIFSEMKSGYKISKGEEMVSLSIQEFNQFENEVFEFVELKFKHLFKQKGEKK